MDIVIDGQRYVPITNGTFSHDIWLQRRIRESGLSNLAMEEGETQDELIERIAILAYESGAALELLGGLFMPEGMDARQWTPEVAAHTAKAFGDATDPAEKQVLKTQIASALFYFFKSALDSLQISLKSGLKKAEDERHATEGASVTGIGAT